MGGDRGLPFPVAAFRCSVKRKRPHPVEIIWDGQFGFLKETLVAPVSRFEIVLGRTLGGATVALIQGSIVFFVCLAAGFRLAQPGLLPLAFLFMVLIAIMCTAIGTAVGSVLQDVQGFQLIMNFIVQPLFFFSSALFPVPDLPGAVRLAVRLDPPAMVSTACAARSAVGFAFGIATDFAVLGGLAAAVCRAAASASRWLLAGVGWQRCHCYTSIFENR